MQAKLQHIALLLHTALIVLSSGQSRQSKMMQYVNWRLKVTITDRLSSAVRRIVLNSLLRRSRVLLGTFLAFDKHMNMVLADCDEYRRVKPKKGANCAQHHLAMKLTQSALSRR
mgnify:CR=1 FL=1